MATKMEVEFIRSCLQKVVFLKTKVQFDFELSLASTADKNFPAKKPKWNFFLKISRELQKIFFETYDTQYLLLMRYVCMTLTYTTLTILCKALEYLINNTWFMFYMQ